MHFRKTVIFMGWFLLIPRERQMTATVGENKNAKNLKTTD